MVQECVYCYPQSMKQLYFSFFDFQLRKFKKFGKLLVKFYFNNPGEGS